MRSELIPVLDHGSVQLIDTMGDDAAILEAARMSTGGAASKGPDLDRSLMRRLMRCGHTSPFEMAEAKFVVKLPIFVARQWIRHRTANVNEWSGRYAELPDEFYVPEPDDVREQSKMNRQGREEEHYALGDVVACFRRATMNTGNDAFAAYHDANEQGLSREITRINLPLSTYTMWTWKIDLHNLLHFLKLRSDKAAQWEIRQYAAAMAKMVEQWCPMAWDAFVEYELEAMKLSRTAILVLQRALERLDDVDVEWMLDDAKQKGMSSAEIRDTLEKLLDI